MADENKEKHYSTCLKLIRLMADTGEGECGAAATLFIRTWAKVVENHQATFPDFFEWASREEAAQNSNNQVDVARVKALFTSAFDGGTAALKDDSFKELKEQLEADLRASSGADKGDILLEIVILEKESQKFQKEGNNVEAQIRREKAASLMAEYGITREEIDDFALVRDQAILGLYKKIDSLEEETDPIKRAAIESEINATALMFGLMFRDANGDLGCTSEFWDGYTEEYSQDKQKYENDIRGRAKGSQERSSGTNGSGQSAPPPPPPPEKINIYPIRTAEGKNAATVAAPSYYDAIQRFLSTRTTASIAQEFELNNVKIDNFKKFNLLQHGTISGWRVAAAEVVWRASDNDPDAAFVESVISADEVDIELGQARNVDIVHGQGRVVVYGAAKDLRINFEDEAIVDLRGPAENANIEFGEFSTLLVANRLDHSMVANNGKDSDIFFDGDAAGAKETTFSSILPIFTQPPVEKKKRASKKPTDKNAPKSFDTAAIANTLATLESLLICITNADRSQRGTSGSPEWSSAFGNPRIITLKDLDTAVVNFLVASMKDGGAFQKIRGLQANNNGAPTGNFRGVKTKLDKLRAEAESRSLPLQLLILPIFPNKKDFETTSTPPDMRSFRLTLFAGDYDYNNLCKRFLAVMAPSQPEFGFPKNFFEDLDQYLADSNVAPVSLNICVDQSGSVTPKSNLRADIVTRLEPYYEKLQEVDMRWGGVFSRSLLMDFNCNYADSGEGFKRGGFSHGREMSAFPLYTKLMEELKDGFPYRDPSTQPRPFTPYADAPVVDGSRLEKCIFSGASSTQKILKSLKGSTLTNFEGTKLTLVGDWEGAIFQHSDIDGASGDILSINNGAFADTKLSLTGGPENVLTANETGSGSSKLNLQKYKDISLKNARHEALELNVEQSANLDLSGATFEGCTLTFKDVETIKAEKAVFIDCTITIENSDKNLSDSKLDLTGASILGKSKVSGRVGKVIADNAQLGADSTSAEVISWQLIPNRMRVPGLKIGNILVEADHVFGKSLRDTEWKKVTVIGSPVIESSSQDIFDMLARALNFVVEHPPLAKDPGAKGAKEFKL